MIPKTEHLILHSIRSKIIAIEYITTLRLLIFLSR